MTKPPATASNLTPPKQDRSRASFERVLNTAQKLFEKNGYDGFTLQEVSRRSKVSIGSIYCRIKSKDDLLHIVQQHVQDKLEREISRITKPAYWEGVDFQTLVRLLIRELGESMRKHASIHRALMAHSPRDPMVWEQGKSAFARHSEQYQKLLLRYQAQIGHPDPKHAVHLCFYVPVASIQKYLGIGILPDSNIAPGGWQQLLDDLAEICLAYLQIKPEIAAEPHRQSSQST